VLVATPPWPTDVARIRQLAGLSAATGRAVAGALRSLSDAGLVVHAPSGWYRTETGDLAAQMIQADRLERAA